ncbi:MAG: PIN domain-containing protein [Trueperaceae bacterium]
MNLFVDTSVWSLALRRDAPVAAPEVAALREALLGAQLVVTTGVVVQELLQGFAGPSRLVERLTALDIVHPDLDDHVEAAEIRNACRRRGVQIGTIDALLIHSCRRHDLVLLSTDGDFRSARVRVAFRLWSAV